MKPWDRARDHGSSDFAVAESPTHAGAESTTRAFAQGVAAIGATTLSLGFAEACALVQSRPIPLPFAARYALYNVIPSAVWSGVSPEVVAAASNLAPERLVAERMVQMSASNLQRPLVNRLVAIKTIRSFRQAVASYGLVWAIWKWQSLNSQDSLPTESPKPEPGATPRFERVLRLAPSGSTLSKASASKHGDHVVHLSWQQARESSSVDWSGFGIRRERKGDALKILELEVDTKHSDLGAFLAAKRAASGASALVATVAVVDAAATPPWESQANGIDVYFFALSSIVQFLCEKYEEYQAHELILVPANVQPDNGNTETNDYNPVEISTLVRRAMIHHRGLPTHVGTHQLMREVDNEESDGDEVTATDQYPCRLVAIIAKTMSDAKHQRDELITAGVPSSTRFVLVVDDSLGHNVPQFADRLSVLSVADLTDYVLQRIREHLRSGDSTESIQRNIFETFGEQSALLCRSDAASDVAKFI